MRNSLLDEVNYAIMRAFFSRPVEEQIFNASPVDNEDLAKAVLEIIKKEMIAAGSTAEFMIQVDDALRE